ncbi:MAG: N-6 DNA methylase [Rhizobiales bacterium]|nr:N-6 DNA methylase [Hyphomicrobiales bacterium]
MSQQLVNNYLNDLDRYKKISGSLTEGVISEAFKDLLKAWARQSNLHFINQYEFASAQKNRIRPDGTILHDLRVPLGYWEAKDSNDDLDAEIAKKLAKGYPQDNIIFEDSATAVLIQNRHEVMRCDMTDTAKLLKLLNLFFCYERAEIAEFRKAVEQFKADLPAVLQALREKIDAAYSENPEFQVEANKFLAHAKDTINPMVNESDVREMLIQHILTEEIFAHVFDQGDFHRENNIAKELYALEAKFFTGSVKRNTLKAMETYYAAIRANAAAISSHSEKQGFLKAIYENFYKVYNPKAADRLGVVYTPNEIVKFMIEGADWLCEKHFGKNLIDRDVEILDPATGTGTFICELLESFRGQPQKLLHKYKNELHANEVAILPYYVANLNIEATYAAISGQFAEFPNLCFVDTLDNVAGLGIRAGHQHDLFAGLSDENVERVKRQNKRKISVIIGNPPYNAWQDNYNSRNPNRPYKRIDERIAATYIKRGTAQNKNSVYDMYTRFIRWASDRLHDDGVIAFITNRNLIEKVAFDGFRRAAADEFAEIRLMDLGGDVRANPKLSGTKHNVFGIQTGVTIGFFVRKRRQQGCKIFYIRRPEFETADEKLSFLSNHRLSTLNAESVEPDRGANWLNQTANDFDNLMPLADPASKGDDRKSRERSLFKLFSNGLKSQRDEWVYDFSRETLEAKVRTLIDTYEATRKSPNDSDRDAIKWDAELDRYAASGVAKEFESRSVVQAEFRPFITRWVYFDRHFNGRTYQLPSMFPKDGKNSVISFLGIASSNPLAVLASNRIFDLGQLKNGNGGTQGVSRWRFTADGTRIDNITDWGLKQFQVHYEKGEKKPKRRITKDDIFHYVYGVLHDPDYRETYAINLKREFPRIPFYPDFWAWAEWGKRLMELHIGYETVKPWPVNRHDQPPGDADPIPKLKADKDNGTITLDSFTTLSGIPPSAWEYRLGNRSGLEWILDQYKEKKPKDPTIAAKFNTYRFMDYKEKVIDLLSRVTRVSVETMEIVNAMKAAKRD